MGYKRDFYSKRDYKRTTNAVSGIIASIIGVFINSGKSKLNSDNHTMTRNEEYNYVLIIALVSTPITLYFATNLFTSDDILTGCILLVLLTIIWITAYFAKKSADKEL